jgi:hypothetical protein
MTSMLRLKRYVGVRLPDRGKKVQRPGHRGKVLMVGFREGYF